MLSLCRLPNAPSIIAMCRCDSDVREVVRYARISSLEVAVRSGGHSIRGMSTGDGVLVVNLSKMNEVCTRDWGCRGRRLRTRRRGSGLAAVRCFPCHFRERIEPHCVAWALFPRWCTTQRERRFWSGVVRCYGTFTGS